MICHDISRVIFSLGPSNFSMCSIEKLEGSGDEATIFECLKIISFSNTDFGSVNLMSLKLRC